MNDMSPEYYALVESAELVVGGVRADGTFIPWETVAAAQKRIAIHEDYGAEYACDGRSIPAQTIIDIADAATEAEVA